LRVLGEGVGFKVASGREGDVSRRTREACCLRAWGLGHGV